MVPSHQHPGGADAGPASAAQTRPELERLGKVYREYARRGFARSKWSAANRGNQALTRERLDCARQRLHQAGFLPLGSRRILEVGCGTGENLAAFQTWGARPEHLVGIDLIPERIRGAQRHLPRVTFQLANAEALPFIDGAFDLVVAFTVLTSILDHEMRSNVCREIQRVLHPGGALLWYDFRMNNPWNRHVRGISRHDLRRLFPDFGLDLQTVTLLPPLARRLGPLTGWFYPRLAAVPFLRSHYLGLLIKP